MSSQVISIGIEKYEKICSEILTGICTKIFPNLVRSGKINHYKLTKIRQNIFLICRNILGIKITENNLQKKIDMIIKKFVASISNDGDPVGVTTAQCVSHPITQDVLKSQHGTGKKQKESSTSLIFLTRLKIHKRFVKIHYKNGNFPNITNSTIKISLNEFIKKYKILSEKPQSSENEKYFEGVSKKFTGDSSKDYPKNKSQIEKAILSFESLAEKKITGDIFDIANSLQLDNIFFRVDFLDFFSEKIIKNLKHFLLTSYEEIKIDDIICVSCGECKYRTFKTEKFYDQQPHYIYTNYSPIEVGSKGFRFQFDATKLKNSDISISHVYEIIAGIPDVSVVFHPLNELVFDIIPGNMSDNQIQKIITDMLQTRIKGIENLTNIEEIKLQISDVVKFYFYDEEKNETHVFLKSRELLYFPIQEIKKRIIGEILYDYTDHCSDHDFKFVYKGKILMLQTPYYYFNFIGTMQTNSIIDSLKKYIDFDYFITNSPQDMINNVGKVGARINHESLITDELNSSGNKLNHQHVSLMCRHLFSDGLLPITPNGFMKGPGINIIDKLCFQNHEQNLSEEIIKNKTYDTDGLTTSIFMGKKPNLGTNYPRFVLNEKAIEEITNLYADARKRQKYLGEFKGVNLPPIGEIKPLSLFLDSFPFPNTVSGK